MEEKRRIDNATATIAKLAEPQALQDFNPFALRFIYSLRLIVLHHHARRDPVPELAARLHSVDLAAKALNLCQTICDCWPENFQIRRFCCNFVSHDEATIARMIECAKMRDRTAFDACISGMIRPGQIAELWEAAQDLVIAEFNAA